MKYWPLKTEVKYLGQVISQKQVQNDPEETEAIEVGRVQTLKLTRAHFLGKPIIASFSSKITDRRKNGKSVCAPKCWSVFKELQKRPM